MWQEHILLCKLIGGIRLQVQVQGLQGLKFLDNTNSMAEGQETGAHLSISGEVDRIFVNTPSQLKVCHQHWGHACWHAAACQQAWALAWREGSVAG